MGAFWPTAAETPAASAWCGADTPAHAITAQDATVRASEEIAGLAKNLLFK
jgi:hypothetical protein